MATAAAASEMTTCVLCGSGDVTTAEGFELTRQTVTDYKKQFLDKWRTSSLPPISTVLEWTVYKLSKSKRYDHQSLFFVPNDVLYASSHGFTIELRVTNTVYPHTDILPSSRTDQLPKLGAVNQSAEALMAAGLKCLADFGHYHKYSNNCQDYVCKLAEELEIKVPWTDIKKAVVQGTAIAGAVLLGVGAIAISAIIGLSVVMGGKEKDRSRKD